MSAPEIVLTRESPFYDLFEDGRVPVQTFLPVRFVLVGSDETRGYLLDGERLDSATLEAIALRMAELRGGRVSDIRDELTERGLPIRESSVAVHPGIDVRFLA